MANMLHRPRPRALCAMLVSTLLAGVAYAQAPSTETQPGPAAAGQSAPAAPVPAVAPAPAIASAAVEKTAFGADLAFLRQHLPVIVLTDPTSRTQVALAPTLQGRVMTSTATGPEGLSYGWINRKFISEGKKVAHLNPYGGEERFWIGPEGGKFSIYFKPGVEQKFADWNTPAFLDTEPFEVVRQSPARASFTKTVEFQNYAGTPFKVKIDREVRLVGPFEAARQLRIKPDHTVKLVAYESDNKLTNAGAQPWTKEKGLLDIWILGMYNPSPATTVVAPYTPGSVETLGKVVNSDYFGAVPPDRLQIKEKTIYLKADGKQRGKIGLPPARAKDIVGSYDAANHVLTLVKYNKPQGKAEYLNMKWGATGEDAFTGDAVNSYNDGPLEDGTQMGPFYELETVSPAFALQPGEWKRHVSLTCHIQGDPAALDKLAQAALGVTLQDVAQAFAGAQK